MSGNDISVIDLSTSTSVCVSITWLPRRHKQNTPNLVEESRINKHTVTINNNNNNNNMQVCKHQTAN